MTLKRIIDGVYLVPMGSANAYPPGCTARI